MKKLILLPLLASLVLAGSASGQIAKTAKPIQLKTMRTAQKDTQKDSGVTGIVLKDGIKPGQFVLGVKDKGRVTVDCSRARFRWRNGKEFDKKRLVGGTMVSIMGESKSGKLSATLITVNYLPDSKPVTKVAKPKPVKVKN